jgi:ABC-type branched-subunit amino acid transport system ATPase component
MAAHDHSHGHADSAAVATESPSHVTLSNLCVRRGGRWVFRGLDLAVPRGTFVAVVGPSGVGKSSLLSAIGGLLNPDEGSVRFICLNNGVHEPCNFQPQIGMVFQNFMLVANSTVLNNVLCGRLGQRPWWRTLLGFSRQDREEASSPTSASGATPTAGSARPPAANSSAPPWPAPSSRSPSCSSPTSPSPTSIPT